MSLPEHPHARKIEEYRRKALDATAHAAAAKDEFVRNTWENIAANYQELADRLTRNLNPKGDPGDARLLDAQRPPMQSTT